MIAKTKIGGVLIVFVLTCILPFSKSISAQNLEKIDLPLTLSSGQVGGLGKQSVITHLSQQPEGLYILTDRKGCYFLSNSLGDPSLSLLLEPSDRKEIFNGLFEAGNQVYLLINYQELLPLRGSGGKRTAFTTPFFANTAQPNEVCVTADEQIVIGTVKDGLFVFSQDEEGRYTFVARHISTAYNQLPSSIINTIYEDRNGTVWVGTDAGLATIYQDSVYNLSRTPAVNRNWLQRFLGTGIPKPVYNDRVTAITQWGNSMVFTDGENLFKISNRPDSLESIYRYNIQNRLATPLGNISQLTTDLNGDLWIGGDQLARYNMTFDDLTLVGSTNNLRGEGILSLVEDPLTGSLWIGTQRGGLYFLQIRP